MPNFTEREMAGQSGCAKRGVRVLQRTQPSTPLATVAVSGNEVHFCHSFQRFKRIFQSKHKIPTSILDYMEKKIRSHKSHLWAEFSTWDSSIATSVLGDTLGHRSTLQDCTQHHSLCSLCYRESRCTAKDAHFSSACLAHRRQVRGTSNCPCSAKPKDKGSKALSGPWGKTHLSQAEDSSVLVSV